MKKLSDWLRTANRNKAQTLYTKEHGNEFMISNAIGSFVINETVLSSNVRASSVGRNTRWMGYRNFQQRNSMRMLFAHIWKGC